MSGLEPLSPGISKGADVLTYNGHFLSTGVQKYVAAKSESITLNLNRRCTKSLMPAWILQSNR